MTYVCHFAGTWTSRNDFLWNKLNEVFNMGEDCVIHCVVDRNDRVTVKFSLEDTFLIE